jgi:hypothetical protein
MNNGLFGWPEGSTVSRVYCDETVSNGTTYRFTAITGMHGVPEVVDKGFAFSALIKTANTGAVSIYVGQHGPYAVKRSGINLIAGEWQPNQTAELQFNGTYFEMQNPPHVFFGWRWVKFDGTYLTATGNNTPADLPTDQLTVTAHGLGSSPPASVSEVPRIVLLNSGGALWTATPALAENTVYYVRTLSANTISLHTTAQGAVDNTARIDITGSGTGTNQIRYFANNFKPSQLTRQFGVEHVVPLDEEGAFVVKWSPTFTTGDSYVTWGCAKENSGTVGRGTSVGISDNDSNSASEKRYQVWSIRGTPAQYQSPEIHIWAYGS